MKRLCMIAVFIPMLISLLSIHGCGPAQKQEKKLVARINNYDLTTDDFKEEARIALSGRYVSLDSEKAREALLGEMVIKNILIQEAQAGNLDKDKDFMKEIERYWEQALLKILIRRKTEEFAAQANATDDEVKKEYELLCKECGPDVIGPLEKNSKKIRKDIRDRKIQKMLEFWVDGLKKRANVKIYKDNLNQVQVK